MRISDWSSDVCSSDLRHLYGSAALCRGIAALSCALCAGCQGQQQAAEQKCCGTPQDAVKKPHAPFSQTCRADSIAGTCATRPLTLAIRSEEHTSELQSLMRISYAVFCLKKKKTNK